MKTPITCKVITMTDNEVSMAAFIKLQNSSYKVGNDFRPDIFEATTAENAENHMTKLLLKWDYPWEGTVTDLKTGLKKSAYPTQNRLNRIACAVSHYRLWALCAKTDEPMLIMEHDAIFIAGLKDYRGILQDSRFDIIGINNPIGNTRRAREFHNILQQSSDPNQDLKHPIAIVPVPTIDSFNIPQGLAGNSAYIIKPKGARMCVRAAQEHGLWPNDALMCKQLIPHMGVTKTYYTNTQQIVSTTT
jgi:GR25 family glycosyltransferase involved in LPS biosynthesis